MKKLLTLLSRAGRSARARRQEAVGRAVGVGTVRTAAERQVFIEVVAVSGETFVGKLVPCDGDTDVAMLRPGLVVLVAFDPAVPEELSLPTDAEAVLAAHVSSV
jgi:hypothetical protein